MLRKIGYPLFGLMMLGGYSLTTLLDYEPMSSVQRSVLSPEARRSPGAYRAPIFWTGAGFTGGK